MVGAFDVTASLQRQRYAYRDLVLPGATGDDRHRADVVRGWSGSLGYRLGNSMRAGVGLTYRERQSNSVHLSYGTL